MNIPPIKVIFAQGGHIGPLSGFAISVKVADKEEEI
jgi:hypothetical protein